MAAKDTREVREALLASARKEMDKPRLTASVRKALARIERGIRKKKIDLNCLPVVGLI